MEGKSGMTLWNRNLPAVKEHRNHQQSFYEGKERPGAEVQNSCCWRGSWGTPSSQHRALPPTGFRPKTPSLMVVMAAGHRGTLLVQILALLEVREAAILVEIPGTEEAGACTPVGYGHQRLADPRPWDRTSWHLAVS